MDEEEAFFLTLGRAPPAHAPPPSQQLFGFSPALTGGLHGLAFVASFVLVSVLFAGAAPPAPLVSFVLSPRDAAHPTLLLTALEGTAPLVKHRALGLFSEMSPVLIALCAQTLMLAFQLAAKVRHSTDDDDDDASVAQARWFFRRVGFGLLLCLGAVLLFVGEHWRIPQNHLLWLELLLALAFFSLGSSHHPDPHRGAWSDGGRLGMAFAFPALAVATLAAAGEDDVLALLGSYVGLCSVQLLWAVMTVDAEDDDDDRRRVLLITLWLCAAPFALYASLRLHAGGGPAYALAALGLTLAWGLGLPALVTALGPGRTGVEWPYHALGVAVVLLLQIAPFA